MNVLFLTNSTEAHEVAAHLSEVDTLVSVDGRIDPALLAEYRPDIIVSYMYRYILDKATLASIKCCAVNLHLSLLPFNRGADPNAWSFIEETPQGVSIHIIDEGIDTGPIISQRSVDLPWEQHTLESSYNVLKEEMFDLFRQTWPAIRSGSFTCNPQSQGGTFHRAAELFRIRQALLGNEGTNVPIATFLDRYRAQAG